VTSFDSFGELVRGYRTFSSLNIMSCLLKAYLNLELPGQGQCQQTFKLWGAFCCPVYSLKYHDGIDLIAKNKTSN
jgi:hypothetical protein